MPALIVFGSLIVCIVAWGWWGLLLWFCLALMLSCLG